MSEGGIYDHLGGGFARYSVDERWLVPHFEKMLYDNAQLLELLALAYLRTGNALFRAARRRDGRLARARDDDAGGRVLPPRSMPIPKARRASSTSGRSPRSKTCSAPDDAAFFARIYDVTAGGNFEGHNILNRLKDLPAADGSIGPWPADGRGCLLRDKLLTSASKRVRPGLDDKVLADWNGLMIAALANAGAMLGEPALDRAGAARLRLRRRAHDARRPARPFLARRQAAVSGPCLRLSPR